MFSTVELESRTIVLWKFCAFECMNKFAGEAAWNARLGQHFHLLMPIIVPLPLCVPESRDKRGMKVSFGGNKKEELFLW